MTEQAKQKLLLKFFNQHRSIAADYARKIFNYERYAFEKKDIIQELEIKILNCIKTWISKYEEYVQTGRYKPIPLKYYLKTAMTNRTVDFIKLFNKPCVENVDKVSIEDNCYDEGIHSTMDSEICFIGAENLTCVINNVDLLYKLKGRERKCFCLYLKGYQISKLRKLFKGLNMEFIAEQVQYLQHRKKDLYDFDVVKFKKFTFAEQD